MLALLRQLKARFDRWWSEFTLQTKLMVLATLIVSLMTTGLTFWAVNSIQQDARMNDTRFGRDLGLLLSTNVAPLLAEEDLAEVAKFSYRFYNNTTSIRYLIYADEDGEIFLGIPFSRSEVQNSLTIERRIQLPENFQKNTDIPMVRQHKTPYGEVTDVFVPLIHEGKYLGILAIGINPNAIVVTSSHITRDVTIAVFIAIWAMVILGAVINALTITRPIKELSEGVKSIAEGNFKQRINLPFGGELGELIRSFNEMGDRLECYDAQNIEELTAEKAKLETLMSTIADGAVLVDTDLRVLLANPTARRLFNWQGIEVSGESLLPNLPHSLRLELSEPLARLLQEGLSPEGMDAIAPSLALTSTSAPSAVELSGFEASSARFDNRHHVDIDTQLHLLNPASASELLETSREATELRLSLEEPIRRTLRILLSKVSDQNLSTVKGIAITVQDVTREAELNEAKSQFISNVSHELRTPLFNIKSFIETLHDYGDELSDTERQEFLATANSETDRLARLVNDVLDLSRLESNRSYHFDAVDIGQAIDQTLRTHRLNAKDKGIEMTHEAADQLPLVYGNYDLILQVLTNLVGNSLKFTSAGGRVVLRAYSLAPQIFTLQGHAASSVELQKVRIEISDTGIGIDPEDQEAIFDRFFRVENRVHTLEGTGLGLSIVRNIVDRHRSKMHLVSEVGVGTTFWLDLDVFQEQVHSALTPAEAAMNDHPQKEHPKEQIHPDT